MIAVFGLGAAMLLKNQPSQNLAPSTQTQESAAPTQSTEESTGDAMSENVQEITVTGSNFKFDKSEIRVKQGDKVKITFKNSGGTHDFVIDELNVKTPVIQSGEEEVAEFTADKAGTFEFYCSIGTHRTMGMKGNLIVE